MLLDIINYTKEWGNILDVFLVFVTITCYTQSCIKKHSIVDGDIIMHKLPKDGTVRNARINAKNSNSTVKKQLENSNSRKSSYFCNGFSAWLIN